MIVEELFTSEEKLELPSFIATKPTSEHNKKLLQLPEIKVDFLSYSQIETFKTCPLKYKFRYLFNIPSPSAHAANFGSSLHNSIHEFYKHLMAEHSPSLDLLQKIYDQCWIGAGYESRAHEKSRKQQGLAVLENFYRAEEKRSFKIPLMMENPFRLKIGGISLTGRIDRIDRLDDGSYEVIDYKTGSSRRDTDISRDMQLSLYAMACRDVFRLPVKKLSFYFLEDAELKSTTRSDSDIDEIKSELKDVSDELAKSDFGAAPGFHCSWCEYRLLCNAV